MRVKMFRQSGNPVDPEKNEQYRLEWKQGFDDLCEKYGKSNPETAEKLDQFEEELLQSYNDLTLINVELPRTGIGWRRMVEKYGNIIVSTCSETGEHAKKGDIVFIINDMELNMG